MIVADTASFKSMRKDFAAGLKNRNKKVGNQSSQRNLQVNLQGSLQKRIEEVADKPKKKKSDVGSM